MALVIADPGCLPATTEQQTEDERGRHWRILGPSLVSAQSTDLVILPLDLGDSRADDDIHRGQSREDVGS
jgi:hypothetical protein